MRIEPLVRPRLLHSLQAALRSGHVLVTAPAGYGKTILLRSLAAYQPYTFYLPLSPADADLPYLQARLRDALPPAYRESQSILMLDDIHHVEGGTEALTWLVEQLQREGPRLVLAGRWIPSSAIGDLATTGKLAHLNASDLAFTLAESQALLARHHTASPSLIAAWHERTGGWPLALALLAQMWTAPNPQPMAEAGLFTYLARTLVQTLPPTLRRFWTLTAVPLRFNDELAAALFDAGGDAVALRREIQYRNLFLEPTEEPGWFRYHELIREFLLQQATEDLTPIFQQTIAWFQARGDLEMAIEHALEASLYDEAARLILQIPADFVKTQGRVWTLRRWVLSLPDRAHSTHPELLFRLIATAHDTGGWPEAWPYLDRLLQLAEATGDTGLRHKALLSKGTLHFLEGAYEHSLAALRPILDDPTCDAAIKAAAYKAMGDTLLGPGRLRQAGWAYRRAITLAEQLGDEGLALRSRHNLAMMILIPLGRFEPARIALEHNAAREQADRPYESGIYLMGYCELYREMGDWPHLESLLAGFRALLDRLDEPIPEDLLYTLWYEAFLAIGRGQFIAAQETLNRAWALDVEDPLAILCLAWAQIWLRRREGRHQEAIRQAEAMLAQRTGWPFYRAILALERDIALGEKRAPLHPETKRLIQSRAGAQLVRLRALLALRCHRAGDPRWRRHVRAALYALRRPGYEHLLTRRDPDLGAPFWALALEGDMAVEQAIAALREIGDPAPVLPLLQHADPTVRTHAARALAAIGREEAMPSLVTALSTERDQHTATALRTALTHLESRPPPPLKVQLMGDFALWRDGELVPDTAWQRPIVRRLFQYFALHRTEALPRDRILDDLWPQAKPEKAWATFRTVYSRLRHVLDPYMRPKSPSRYVAVEGETYRFDPYDVVHVDVEAFEAAVYRTLSVAGEADIPPLSDELLTALAEWKPLLPELPYTEWLLTARERLNELYMEGCLYAARAFLAHGRPGEAVNWARRAVQVAPWLEEGYQALMRAYARQGQRGLALKTYEEALTALRRELDAPPSPLTRWLVERLHRGEDI